MEIQVGFQSSPALSGRCNLRRRDNWAQRSGFQSSPALSGRCNLPGLGLHCHALFVSILTGPFGPVQLKEIETAKRHLRVSILTGPFGPVQPAGIRF